MTKTAARRPAAREPVKANLIETAPDLESDSGAGAGDWV